MGVRRNALGTTLFANADIDPNHAYLLGLLGLCWLNLFKILFEKIR